MMANSIPKEASISNALQRLLKPRHIALIGGRSAQEALRQCQQLGYQGQLWPIHPTLGSIEGVPCYPSVEALPEAPDASFIAVNADATVAQVKALAERGAGGLVCYASGFAEVGGAGIQKQQALMEAAAGLPLLGPNCYGMLNYLDGTALWPDQHGGKRVSKGVAIITQSGNIGLNLTMQRRALPLAYLITLGNQAGCEFAQLIEALLADERVTAIGLHIEGLGDVAEFSRVALLALQKGVPLVALKAGSSAKGAQMTMSHTSSLSGADQLHDALFERFGVARVFDAGTLLETLKLMHVHGALPDARIISASCSGGEASLVADLAERHGLTLPDLPPIADSQLRHVLGPRVHVANPLDYHTYIWGDLAAQTDCFAAMMACEFDNHLLVLDMPREDRCSGASWQTTLDGFVAAQKQTGAKASMISLMPEGFPEPLAQVLLEQGIAPLMGLQDGLIAVAMAAFVGRRQACAGSLQALNPRTMRPAIPAGGTDLTTLNEVQSKQALAAFGLPLPEGYQWSFSEIAEQAQALRYPVVLKAVSSTLAHKSEHGAVRLHLQTPEQLMQAAKEMRHLSDTFLVERMMVGAVAELIVGLNYDAQFGLTLTLGAGGIWVEILKDSQSLLLPASRQDLRNALNRLRMAPLLHGFRGKPAGDLEATLNAIEAICRYAQAHANSLLELDVNPLLVLPEGQGCVAVDALIRLQENTGAL
jgi:acetyl-CoA synthetase